MTRLLQEQGQLLPTPRAMHQGKGGHPVGPGHYWFDMRKLTPLG